MAPTASNAVGTAIQLKEEIITSSPSPIPADLKQAAIAPRPVEKRKTIKSPNVFRTESANVFLFSDGLFQIEKNKDTRIKKVC